MKKLIQILAASIMSVGLMAGAASADTVTCGNITNTGPGSTNTITCVDVNNTQVTCNNDDKVVTSNDQSSNSGNAFTVDNTYSGDSNSGDSNNSNTVTVNLGDSCAPQVAAVTTPTTTPTVTPATTTTPVVTPSVTKPATPVQKSVAALPNTGSSTLLDDSALTVAVVGGTIAVSQLGVFAYRRFALK